MEIIDTIGRLIDYGLSFAVFAAIIAAFLTDNLSSGKSRDREIARERELTNKALSQVDGLTDALGQLSDAWEKRNDIEEARQQERFEFLKEQKS